MHSAPARRITFPLLALILLSLAPGCDVAGPPEPRAIVYGDVTHRAEGEATLRMERGALTAVNLETEDGFSLDTAPYRRGDLLFKPVSFRRGGMLTLDLIGGLSRDDERSLAKIVHRGQPDGLKYIELDLSGLGAKAATIEFYLKDRLVYRKEHMPLSYESGTGHPVGITNDVPTSFHYETRIEDGHEVTVVVFDYDKTAAGFATIQPSFDDVGVVTSSHVVVIPKDGDGTDRRVRGIRITGSKVGALRILKERFE